MIESSRTAIAVVTIGGSFCASIPSTRAARPGPRDVAHSAGWRMCRAPSRWRAVQNWEPPARAACTFVRRLRDGAPRPEHVPEPPRREHAGERDHGLEPEEAR